MVSAQWLSVLPLVGLGPSLDRGVDVVAYGQAALATTRASLEPLVTRAAELAWDRVVPGETDLLAFLLVRDRDLAPEVDLRCPEVLHYRERLRFPDLERQAESLAGKGYLAVSEAETVNGCPACGSARVLVRETCAACGSSDVTDEAILHHFNCACQEPEREFRDGAGLRCPKCRQVLTALGVDYDAPATVTLCRCCGHGSQEPDVGFRCLDCGTRDRADRLIARRVLSYRVTQAGRNAVTDSTTPPAGPADGAASAS